jgi:hypothetical protein
LRYRRRARLPAVRPEPRPNDIFPGFSPGYGPTQPDFFVDSATYQRQRIFHIERFAVLLIDVLTSYREQGKYELHEFVLMPDHIHLLITPGRTCSLGACDAVHQERLFLSCEKGTQVSIRHLAAKFHRPSRQLGQDAGGMAVQLRPRTRPTGCSTAIAQGLKPKKPKKRREFIAARLEAVLFYGAANVVLAINSRVSKMAFGASFCPRLCCCSQRHSRGRLCHNSNTRT